MDRKKTRNRKFIISSGGVAVLSGFVITRELTFLQMLIRLLKMGFLPRGGNISLCRITCTFSQEEVIRKRAEKEKNLILLSDEDGGEKETSSRFGKTKKISLRELVIAACGDELFFLIDLNPEKFEILSPEAAAAVTEDFYKKGLKGKYR